ncbi:MAG: hypothetical protein AAFR55_10000 [Pseudomonadota bacterium]
MQTTGKLLTAAFATIVSGAAAFAHPGHVETVANHDHGGGLMVALVAAFAVAAAALLVIRARR